MYWLIIILFENSLPKVLTINVIFKIKPKTRSNTIESNKMAYRPRNIHVHDIQYVSLISTCNLYKNQFTEIRGGKKNTFMYNDRYFWRNPIA